MIRSPTTTSTEETYRRDYQKTEILYGAKDAVGRGVEFMKNVRERMDISFDHRAPSIVTELAEYRDGYKDILRRGGKIRCLTDITKDNLPFCKKLLDLVSELRHFSGLNGGIAVNGTEYMATTALREARPLAMVIYSNVEELVEQGQSIFDALWNSAVPAGQRIRELEEGSEVEYIEVVRDPTKARDLIIQFTKSIQREAEIVLPVSESAARLARLGVWEDLIRASNAGSRIRVISPISDINSEIFDDVSRRSTVKILKGEASPTGLFIIDGKRFLRGDMRDHTAMDTVDSIGTVVHSNSMVEQLSTFFELLWKQAELYGDLLDYNAMQNEFIAVAAHELRTPVQPILGLAQILKTKAVDEETRMMLDVIIKNANRLIRLEENILDVARMEGHALNLKKQRLNVQEIIMDALEIYNGQAKEKNIVIKTKHPAMDLYVWADRNRIMQVLSNLLSNAIKFTRDGTIVIEVREIIEGSKKAVITVNDTGKGIDPQILPRLFTKFTTKSEDGTGLGLFICRGIVEAHGGTIWAGNRIDSGASFNFSIPSS